MSAICLELQPPVGIPSFDLKHLSWYVTKASSNVNLINLSITIFVLLSKDSSELSMSFNASIAKFSLIEGYSFSTSMVNKLSCWFGCLSFLLYSLISSVRCGVFFNVLVFNIYLACWS